MEDHIVVDLPEELSNILETRHDSIQVSYSLDPNGNGVSEYLFQIEQDYYYASLLKSPVHLELHKSKKKQETDLYKLSDIHKVLRVSLVKTSDGNRPINYQDKSEGIAPDGLTKPAKGIKKKLEEYKKNKILGVSSTELAKSSELLEDLEEEVMKREKSNQKEALKPFIYEEVIEEEPFMSYWDERTIINQGEDNYTKDCKEAFEKAYQKYIHRKKATNLAEQAKQKTEVKRPLE
eukprot:snap_masked-scaffold_1-processed-gene-11.29-mRNA-1 protein AED:1.00 eAED:1.00 QI:0/-1/0/1/-1/1/1/0/234